MTDKEQTIARAAEILGKSPRTILRWIQSGKIPAHKAAGEWRVDISGVMPSDVSDDVSSHASVMSEMAAEILDLKDEILTLKAQLTEKDKQISELHVIIARAQPKQLSEPGKRPWWMFWRR